MKTNRPFVDFKAIKMRVTIAALLAHYNVRLVRSNQAAHKGDCPLPTHSSASKGTFYVNNEKSVWYCHSDSCKKNGQRAGGNVIDFVMLMEQCSSYDAAKRLEEMFPIAATDRSEFVERETAGSRVIEPSPDPSEGLNAPLAFALKNIDPSHSLIQERGISAATAEGYGVGFFSGKGSMASRIVFPLRENGTLVGYLGRTTLPVSDLNPKWLFGKGLKKTFLFGLDRCDPGKAVVLCESTWGPLWFREYGIQAASLMGSEMTAEQERVLRPFSMITIAFDNDAVGQERAAHIRERLARNHKVLKARLIETPRS